MYEKYVFNFYDDQQFQFYEMEFLKIVKKRLGELEHPALITVRTSNKLKKIIRNSQKKNTDYQGKTM